MRNREDLINNARLILAEKGQDGDASNTIVGSSQISGVVSRGSCKFFKDDEVTIVANKNDKSMEITIYGDKQTGGEFGNPAVMVNADGKCYRCHGEVWNFEDHIAKLARKA